MAHDDKEIARQAMKERLKLIKKKFEEEEDREYKRKIDIVFEPQKLKILKKQLRKEIMNLPKLKTQHRKLLRFLWNGKPKSIREIKNIYDYKHSIEDVKSFVYRLNKLIIGKAKIKHCRDLKLPGHYRLIIRNDTK